MYPYRGLLITAFGPKQIKAIRESMIVEGLAISTINQCVNNIRQIMKWGVEELVPVNVYQALRCVSGLRAGYTDAKECTPVLPVDEKIVKATLPFLPPLVREMVKLHMCVGCRPSEICNLRVRNIDTSQTPWRVELTEHKNQKRGKNRVMYFGPKARLIVGPLISEMTPDDFVFSPRESQRIRNESRSRKVPINQGNRKLYSSFTRSGRAMQRGPGDAYTKDSYNRAVQRACRKAFPAPSGLSAIEVEAWHKEHNWTPGQIRHTVGTSVRQTEGIELSSLVLGHANIRTTEIYAEKNWQSLRAFMETSG
jgi:integrase